MQKQSSSPTRLFACDRRLICKPGVMGLVLDREGFSKATRSSMAIAKTNRRSTNAESLEQPPGRKGGGTVIVDRGMAFDENLQQIQARGHHYVVPAVNRSACNGSTISSKSRAGRKSCESPRRPTRRRTSPRFGSNGSRPPIISTFCVEARGAKPRIGRFAKSRRSASWPTSIVSRRESPRNGSWKRKSMRPSAA